MSQDTPSQPSSSPQQQRQHSHQSSPILTPTPASPSRPSTPPPSEKLRPVTSMVTSTPVHEDAPRSEVLYSGYRSELNDSLDKSGPEDEGDYSDEQYGARSPGCGSGTYTNDSYSDRRLNYDNSMSPDKDDVENRRSPGGPPPFPPSPYRHFPASSVAVFNSAISGYPPDFARMRFRAYDQMASTESTTSVTYSYGTPPKDSHPDRYPYERDEGAESPGYRSGSDRERGPQFSPSHDRYSRYSSREDAGDSMKLNRSFSPKREGSSPNDTSFLNSTDNMSNASRSPKSLYPHSPGNGGVFPRDPRDSPRGYRHPEMLSPSSAGKIRPMFEGGLPHMPLPPRFGDSGMPLPHPQPPPSAVDGKTHVFFCHLCSYSGPTKEEFDAHMSIHFEYNCPHCDYTSRTEGRLKRHIKDFHTDPENKQRTMPGRPKIFRCKQCEFSCINKVEFWAHARTHIKEDKLLQCPRCPFVTEYKHHLEYHLRNHFGSKPFKCTKCNYSCVNKSMLNSHMKSHTNVYQYRCADCTYATKYCHSLKLHLRKYGHKPATVLNSDGSLPQGIDAEISGLSLLAKRGPPRGPRGLRGKDKDGGMGDAFLPPTMCPPLYMTPGDMSPMNPLLNRGLMPGPYWPMIANRMHPPPPLIPVTGMGGPRHPFLPGFEKLNELGHNFGPDPEHDAGGSERDSSSAIKCNMCSYSAETIDSLEAHVLKVHAAENRDLLSVLPFNITSESLLEEQAQRMQARRMSAPPGQTGGVPVSSAHAPRGQDTSPDAYLRRHTMPGAESSPLRVHTKQIISELIKSNPSWPRSMHGGEMNGERAFPRSFYRSNGRDRDREQEADMRDAPQEGADILRQMTLKFGASVPASSPSRPPLPVPAANLDVASVPSPLHGALDLTKPRSLTSPYIQSPPSAALMDDFPHGAMPESLKRKLSGEANSSEDNSCPGDVPMVNPRKRSRKGKAYKLDALCLKLQEKHTASPYDSDCEDSPPTPEAPRPGETEADKKDEDEYDDYSDRRVERSVGTEHPGRTAELERLQRENSDMDAREQEENTSMMDNEFEQLQKNLHILNSDAQSADACGHNVPEESSLRQPSRLDETTLNEGRLSPEKSPMPRDAVDDSSPPPLTKEDSHEPEDSIKNRASIISAIYQSQHDAVPPAVRRGTELALKIFKETTGRTSPPNSKTSEPDFPLPIPPPSVSAPSHKNGMSHDLHKIALSKQPLNVCGPSRSPVTLLPARMSTHAQTQPPAAAKIMEEMGLASRLMPPSPRKEIFECPYCDISFRNGVMFSMHMGYHGSPNPYKCNICGQISRDSVDFFLHIARNAHT